MVLDVERRAKLIRHVNNKRWWHCPPLDPDAYRLRGKFFASSYCEAELYGRPLDQPERVQVTNPVVGDEAAILIELFGSVAQLNEITDLSGERAVEARFALDAKMKTRALDIGHDAIILMSPKAHRRYLESGAIPTSLELNVF